LRTRKVHHGTVDWLTAVIARTPLPDRRRFLGLQPDMKAGAIAQIDDGRWKVSARSTKRMILSQASAVQAPA